MANGVYDVRFTVLRRTETGRTRSNEPLYQWGEPPEGTLRYTGKRLMLNAGEEIRQGVKEATSTIKLEVKGQKIPISAVDRVRLVATGVVYRITAEPVRNKRTTVLVLENVQE